MGRSAGPNVNASAACASGVMDEFSEKENGEHTWTGCQQLYSSRPLARWTCVWRGETNANRRFVDFEETDLSDWADRPDDDLRGGDTRRVEAVNFAAEPKMQKEPRIAVTLRSRSDESAGGLNQSMQQLREAPRLEFSRRVFAVAGC